MKKVLVSACLLGERVRYDGQAKTVHSDVLVRWLVEGRVVRVCPEVAGGLGTPRPPAEQRGAQVLDVHGRDVTAAFQAGAEHALTLAAEHEIAVAVLKEGSPSCGASLVGDGTFSGQKRAGEGVTVTRLRALGVRVFSELELEAADAALRALEAPEE